MRTTEIAAKYKLVLIELNHFVRRSGIPYKESFTGTITIESGYDIESLVNDFLADKQRLENSKPKALAQIAADHRISLDELVEYVKVKEIPHKGSCSGAYFDGGFDVEGFVNGFLADKEKQKEQCKREQEQRKREMEEEIRENARYQAELQAELSKILVTPGFNFEGYEIVEYSDYVFGECLVEGFRGGIESLRDDDMVLESLASGRCNALNKIKLTARRLGCNAVIGLKFDYTILEQTDGFCGYKLCITADGCAVTVKKVNRRSVTSS